MKRLSTPLRPVYAFWNCLTSVGVSPDLAQDENKYIRFTNVLAVLTAVAVVCYIPFTLMNGYYALSVLQAVDILFVLAALWFNYRQFHKVARHVYIVVINFFVLINSCFI